MSKLFVRERGKGRTIVLVHGFPFTHALWDSFAEILAAEFHVVTPDLPGFGSSPLIHPLTINRVGAEVLNWVREHHIQKPIIIGHSLGGYVTLAMAKQSPEMLGGIGLFHSTALADSAEKKASRDKVIEFIDKNGVEKFTSNFIGPLFADPNHPSIKTIQSISVKAKEETVKAYTLAMRDRAERTDVVRSLSTPVLLIAGAKDGGIPVESIEKQSALNPQSELHVLPDVGHMGMIEEEAQTVEIVKRFIERIRVTS